MTNAEGIIIALLIAVLFQVIDAAFWLRAAIVCLGIGVGVMAAEIMGMI